MNFNENRKIMMVVTTCLILSVWLPSVSASRKVISSQTGAPKEVKPKYAMKLCGKDFIQAWKNICKLKQSKQNARGRKRRSLTGISTFIKLRTIDIREELLAPENAKQFLGGLHSRNRRKRSVGSDLDNGNEECCQETCTFGEIAEYSC